MLESKDWSRLRARDARRTVLHASDVGPDEVRTLLDCKEEAFWLDIDSAVPEHIALLADVFGFHPLAIEDALNPRTRVKLEQYDGYLFVVLRAMRFDSEKPFDERELAVKKLCLFIGSNYFVSVHAGASSSLGVALARFEQEPELIQEGGPARLAHLVCDAVVDAYFPILDRVDDGVDRLEHGGMDQLDRGTFDEILRVRRLAFAARRSILPQRTIFDALAHRINPLIADDARLYFRDVFDHAERIIDSLDAYRELIANTTDSYLARSSMRKIAGIKVPIIAGLMPITSPGTYKRIPELALGTRYPARLQRSLQRALERSPTDPDAVKRVGIHWATEQARDLLDHNVRGIHFYTLNHSQATREIYKTLSIAPPQKPAA